MRELTRKQKLMLKAEWKRLRKTGVKFPKLKDIPWKTYSEINEINPCEIFYQNVDHYFHELNWEADGMLSQLQLKTFLEKIQHNLSHAYMRWQDEREYEDINDYSVYFKKEIKEYGGELIKMTKRPFGFKVKFGSDVLQVYCNSKEMGIKETV
jgi:hypothetical protein